MQYLIGALMLLAPLVPFETAIQAEAPDKCYKGVVVLDPSCAPYGICDVVYEEVPCPDEG